MDNFLSMLSDKAIELVIAGTAIIIIAIGRIIFVKERRAATARLIEVEPVSNENLAEAIKSLDRSMAQRFDSLARHTETVVEETHKETTRQFERIHDRFNQLRNN